MADTDSPNLLFIPMWSSLREPEEETERFLREWRNVPANLKTILSSPTTAAYLTGVAKTFKVPVEQVPEIAYLVLQIGLAREQLENLNSRLARLLSLAPDTAHTMAKELEESLFMPVMLELVSQQHQKPPQVSRAPSPPERNVAQPLPQQLPTTPPPRQPMVLSKNVIDLKNQPPRSTPVPPRTSFPAGQPR
jgi:hypothetical protein